MKRREKRTTLSKKLLLGLLGAIVCSVMAVTLVGFILGMPFGKETMRNALYVSQLIIFALIVLLFYRIVDRLILRRLQALSDAMTQVEEGNFEITVPVTGRDELSRLTESFNRMTGELRANAFLSRDFARYVSHEFKTPLAVIRNYAEITQTEAAHAEVARNMDVVISEADRLTGLSRDLLELCRLDSTTIIEKKDHFSPAAQLRSVLLDLQLLRVEKGIDMDLELEEFCIDGNEALLFRVWQNLIGNAIKFTGENGRISVTLRQDSTGFVCEISDDGVGIREEDKEHIFAPFYSGNRSCNRDGSGLGLSLSKKIVDKLGGTIDFESEIGAGSTFTVRIP